MGERTAGIYSPRISNGTLILEVVNRGSECGPKGELRAVSGSRWIWRDVITAEACEEQITHYLMLNQQPTSSARN